ncbi:helix-turn-helix transcriptional regulator [Chitinophaga sp. GCM10012297]|uniref:Helix-turn-helix transcriptional regulator n=1 Tax=Chitinophaga chungangae TaxID=2821488 RepID=A0ABS3YDY2_9BACT|nr:helix-turn-helix transcriptional regulator [Chitinophaga chungangae]MBO9152878.1 helix-turn-helix transcriptional regulator [Chitinophaga chungangae]
MAKDRIEYNRIRVILAEKNRKNKDIAEAIGVSEQTVSKWVTNTSQPALQQLFAIAGFLGVDRAELLGSGKLLNDNQ